MIFCELSLSFLLLFFFCVTSIYSSFPFLRLFGIYIINNVCCNLYFLFLFFSVEHVCIQSLQTTFYIPLHFPRHFNPMVQDSRGEETNEKEAEDNREEHTPAQRVPDDYGKRALLSVIIPQYCVYCTLY